MAPLSSLRGAQRRGNPPSGARKVALDFPRRLPSNWPGKRGSAAVHRLTISLDDTIAAAIDAFMEKQGYSNRSEAVRDLVRDALVRSEGAGPSTHRCVAAVSYVYDYDGRDLAMRLDKAQHENHDLTISSMRTRLDHRHCMEVTLLRGHTD